MSYQCPFCPLRFSLRNERDYHLREDHPRRPAAEPASKLDRPGQSNVPGAPAETAPSVATVPPMTTNEPPGARGDDVTTGSRQAPWWRRWRKARAKHRP